MQLPVADKRDAVGLVVVSRQGSAPKATITAIQIGSRQWSVFSGQAEGAAPGAATRYSKRIAHKGDLYFRRRCVSILSIERLTVPAPVR
jgi:hypothetical protein